MAKVKKSAARTKTTTTTTKSINKAARVEFRSNEGKSPSSKSHSAAGHDGVIEPAKGKLGVMIPGMGAVATTFVAGVEAIRKRLASPIGSLTQMGTIRLGKRTEGRSPLVKEFVPLAGLDDLALSLTPVLYGLLGTSSQEARALLRRRIVGADSLVGPVPS